MNVMQPIKEHINVANQEVADRLISAHPVLVDIRSACDVVPGMTKTTILHAGPPISWERMCIPMRGAVMGALIYEGLARNPVEAESLAGSGAITFSPCHHHNAVGSMAGIISASMPVFVVKNATYGNVAYCAIHDGGGKTVRYGSYDDEAIQKLKFVQETVAPGLEAALKQASGINLKNITAQALQMGDECHSRNDAGTLLFLKEIMPFLLKTDLGKETISAVVESISRNKLFYLSLSMASSKAILDAAHGMEYSTIVTAIARNGVEVGIRVSGLGDTWFTAPAPQIQGLYFPGYSAEDANPDLGDSSISEAAGIGGFAMAAAPAMAWFVGRMNADAVNYTNEMKEITFTKNRNYAIPALDFEGSPTGIDIRKVVETGITPVINTAIAPNKVGVGEMIGAGITHAPMEVFQQALRTMASRLRL